METLSIGRWVVSYDAETTRKAYAQIESGDAERCGCEYCLNFARVRDDVYPEEALKILNQLGVDFRKEAEVYHFSKVKPGWHHYGGSLHFVGKIEKVVHELRPTDGEPTRFLKLAENFSWLLSSRRELVPDVFGDLPVVQIIIDAKVPWVLDTDEPA
ncbi:MAG: hypothetical protein ACYSUC_05675 [Planctomycetota bacterium]|jgi:hypothetical protein